MSENTTFNDLDENEVPTSYTSSTPAAATNRPAIKAPEVKKAKKAKKAKKVEAVAPEAVKTETKKN